MPAADRPTANCQTSKCHRHIAKHETSKPNQQAPDREPPNDHIMPTANRPTPNRQPQPPTGQLPTTNRLRAKGDNSGFRVRVLNSTPRATLDHEICTTKNYEKGMCFRLRFLYFFHQTRDIFENFNLSFVPGNKEIKQMTSKFYFIKSIWRPSWRQIDLMK